MDGSFNDNVMCCFCGDTVSMDKAAVLTIQSSLKNDEKQQLFCHRTCLVEKVDKSVILHPDFFDEDDL